MSLLFSFASFLLNLLLCSETIGIEGLDIYLLIQ